VEGLDALDGNPIVDVKPCNLNYYITGDVKVADWMVENGIPSAPISALYAFSNEFLPQNEGWHDYPLVWDAMMWCTRQITILKRNPFLELTIPFRHDNFGKNEIYDRRRLLDNSPSNLFRWC